MINVFCTASDGGETAITGFKHVLMRLGCNITAYDTSSMIGSDGVFIYLTGSQHHKVKDDLNLILNKGIPVAYVCDEDAVIDEGLEMQLGLATCIDCGRSDDNGPETEISDRGISRLREWIDSIDLNRKKKKKHQLSIILIAAAAIALIASAALYFASGGSGSRMEGSGREKASFDPEAFLKETDIKEAVSLDLKGKGINNISFLKDAVKLEELDLSDNELSDISPLSQLTGLRVLKLSGNHISDLTPLAKLEKLEILDLADNEIDYINQLLTLKNLKMLDVSGNSITDKTAFEFMEEVEITE